MTKTTFGKKETMEIIMEGLRKKHPKIKWERFKISFMRTKREGKAEILIKAEQ